ncbi:MAG: GNAT family N-acetyltransferase [Spirochaetales bacterium]|nr:GNAT family N-acetyltransferase [Spirochaetales bacterium]
MEKIKLIKEKKDESAYRELAAYCFSDSIGWTERIFPLEPGDTAYGIFDNDILTSGAMSRSFQIYIFNTLIEMAGIAAVESGPQFRNRGYIRKLIKQIFIDELKKGKIVSVLMPFKHKFYEKFGFGDFGGTTATTFDPENIITRHGCNGEFIRFNGNKEQLSDMYDVHDIWVRNFTGGIISRRKSLAKFKDDLKWLKDHLFLYYKNDECKAYLRYHLNIKAQYTTDLEIKKAAWKDNAGFSGILHFCASHRDQCRQIEWKSPNNIPLHMLCKTPRISQNLLHDYMIRPLDVKKILQLKADFTPATEKITFSIEDEIIPENSGTYIIEGKEVTKTVFNRKNKLPFHIFSSLIFGAYSLKELELSGFTDTSFPITAYSFFQKNHDIYVSEMF